jgi:hypothetical protein
MHDLMNKQMKNNGWLWWIVKMISKYFLSENQIRSAENQIFDSIEPVALTNVLDLANAFST